MEYKNQNKGKIKFCLLCNGVVNSDLILQPQLNVMRENKSSFVHVIELELLTRNIKFMRNCKSKEKVQDSN